MSSSRNGESRGKNDSIRRLSFLGVSVSPKGFIALLSTSSNVGDDIALPIRISSNPNDEFSASSVEALTFLQLLGGVDVASEGVLPVQTLQHIIALSCSEGNDEESVGAAKIMQDALDGINYVTASPWQRVRVKYPTVGLDGVQVASAKQKTMMTNPTADDPPIVDVHFILDCTVEGKPLSIPLSNSLLQNLAASSSFSSTSENSTLAAFLSLTLALRYKVPITSSTLLSLSPFTLLTQSKNDTSGNIIHQMYPEWKSATSLEIQTSRVVSRISKGFEANRLDGALKIAIQRGDKGAERKIREKMKEFESLDDLPVASESSPDAAILWDGEDGSWA